MIYRIGPFQHGTEANTMTLLPGRYVLNIPITFGFLPETRIECVEFSGDLPSDGVRDLMERRSGTKLTSDSDRAQNQP